MSSDDLARAERILGASISVAELLAYLRDDRYLTKQSATAHIDHHDVRVIEHAIRRGELPAYRIGKKTLIKKSDLEAWVMRGRIDIETGDEGKSQLQTVMDRVIQTAKANIERRRR